MNLKIFVVRDSATNQYGTPMFLVAAGQATRSFSDEVNRKGDAQNQLAAHPEDFELFECGSFDTVTCQFLTHEPRQIARGVDVKVPE